MAYQGVGLKKVFLDIKLFTWHVVPNSALRATATDADSSGDGVGREDSFTELGILGNIHLANKNFLVFVESKIGLSASLDQVCKISNGNHRRNV